MSIQMIIQSLIELVHIHDELIQLSKKKTDVIKVASTEKLQQLLIEETKLINKLEQAEGKRESRVNDWFIERQQPEADRTITRLLELVTDEQAKLELEKATIALTKSITQLKQQEHLNMELIKQSMQFVQLSLDMLNPSIKNLNYGNDRLRKPKNDRSMFDSRA